MKRIGAVAVLLACTLAGGAKPVSAACDSSLGDLDQSGVVSITDVQCAVLLSLWQLAGAVPPAPPCAASLESADVDCKGDFNVVDVQLTIRVALDLPLELAVDANDDGCPDSCEPPAPAVPIVISEIFYDAVGPDENSFVELSGPPGADLAGAELVGINGNGGGEYNLIALSGVIPSDGLFVVGHPEADAWILNASDLLNDNANYQNGPDTLVLRRAGIIYDAVGYGVFTPADIFAGEGAPAPDPAPGFSIGRDAFQTDTNNNAADFFAIAQPNPGQPNAALPNAPPVANLSCPLSGNAGAAVQFDGLASSDQDGTVATYAFDFGDQSAEVGQTATVTHVYANPGTYEVVLTVFDDDGASDTDLCEVEILGNLNPPTVTLVKPLPGTQLTHGQNLQVLVNAVPAPGKTISDVQLLLDGAVVGSPDSVAPFEFNWTVPGNFPPNTNVSVAARARDSQNVTADSPTVSVLVKNQLPSAAFTAIVQGPTTVLLDASASSDTESPKAALEVRWDFTNDGVWDTPFSTNKTVTHQYPAQGTYTVTVEVRDEVGLTDTATSEVSLSTIQYVSGTIGTSNWFGTIVITGDVTVSPGATLTVQPGTSVTVADVDQNNDGIGDYDIIVQGNIQVQGDEDSPVLFTVVGGAGDASSWGGIDLTGTGSVVQHAIIEHAHIGLDIKAPATIADVEVNGGTTGMFISGSGATPVSVSGFSANGNAQNGIDQTAGGANIAGCALMGNGANGILVRGGTSSLTNCFIDNNGKNGGRAEQGGTLNITLSTISNNGNTGLEYYGSGKGTVDKNQILQNDEEGARVVIFGSASPPVIRYNNFSNNAQVRAMVAGNLSISAGSSTSGTGVFTSSAASVPGNHPIALVRYAYNETSGSSISGAIRKSNSSGATVASFASNSAGWADIQGGQATSIVAVVEDFTSSGSGSLSVARAAWLQPGAKREITVIADGVTADTRFNYYGTFTNVQALWTLGDPEDMEPQGFVGAPYDSQWVRGPYVGGETLVGNVVWSGTIFVTGDLTVAPTASLTVSAGTVVRVYPIDLAGDGQGDYDITVNGLFSSLGNASSQVTFQSQTGGTGATQWGGIDIFGASTLIQHTTIRNAQTALDVNQAGQIANLRLESCHHGLEVGSPAGQWVTVSNSNILGCAGDGFRGFSGHAQITSSVIDDSGDIGARISGGVVQFNTCNITNSTSTGLFATSDAVVDVSDSTISGNGGVGLEYALSGSGTVTRNQITFNNEEGVRISAAPGKSGPVVQRNNIFGNALVRAMVYGPVNITSASTTSGTGTFPSATFTAPGGSPIRVVRYVYNESAASIEGVIKSQQGNPVFTVSSSLAGWAELSGTFSAIYAEVADFTTSGSASLSVVRAGWLQNGAARQLSVYADGGTVDTRFNYYGTFANVPGQISLGDPDDANIQGFVGVPFDATWNRGPYVGGETYSQDSSWSGTIFLTGDLTTAAGTTLTLAPGTEVRAYPVDLAADGQGDYDLIVNGAIVTAGTPASPTRFIAESGTSKFLWGGIDLNGAGSTLNHITVLNAAVGLDVKANATVQGASIRDGGRGLWVSSSGATLTATDVEVKDSAIDGVVVSAGNLNANGLTVSGSAEYGVRQSGGTSTITNASVSGGGIGGVYVHTGGTCNISNSTVTANAGVGLEFFRDGKGLITKNHITNNANEGVRVSVDEGKVGPTVTLNNIMGNGSSGGLVFGSPNITATSSTSGTGSFPSTAWTSPSARKIAWVRATYTETSSSIEGYVRKTNGSGEVIATYASPSQDWKYTLGGQAGTIVATIDDFTSSGSASLVVHRAGWVDPFKDIQVSVLSSAGPVSLTRNYFGIFPNPETVISLGDWDDADIQGFVGVPFGPDWSTGPYYHGSLGVAPIWSGELWVTGSLSLAANQTLTILPGTVVRVASTNLNPAAGGDVAINLQGAIVAQGLPGSPITFTSPEGFGAPGAWSGLTVKANSSFSNVFIENAVNGLTLDGGSHTLDTVEVQDSTAVGITAKTGAIVAMSTTTVQASGTHGVLAQGATVNAYDLIVDGSGTTGIFVTAGGVADIDESEISNGGAWGVRVVGNTSQTSLLNTVINGNDGTAIEVEDGDLVAERIAVTLNGMGLSWIGSAGGSLTWSEVTANDREALLFHSSSGGHPNPVIQSNNFFGNSLVAGGVAASVSISATSSNSGVGTFTSPAFTAPSGADILTIRYAYNETTSSIDGNILRSSDLASVLSVPSSVSSTFATISAYGFASGTKGVVAQVSDFTPSGSASLSITGAYYRLPGTLTEVAVFTDSGTVNCTGNYWGVFPDVLSRVALGRTNAVDITGFVGTPIVGTGPQ